jgi:hypothetical protein
MGKLTVLGKDEWIPSTKVITALGKSERSIQRLAAAGHLRWKQQDGRRVYHAGDVAKVKEEGIRTERSEPRDPQPKLTLYAALWSSSSLRSKRRGRLQQRRNSGWIWKKRASTAALESACWFD